MTDSDLTGSVIDGRYRITRILGAGAMGSVYEAEHTGTNRRVAVKLINATDINKNASLISRFHREAKAAGSIDTQHITQVLDTGTDRDSSLPFMVMEYLSGEDLQQALHRIGPFSPDLALRVVAQACIGLQKAHEAHVVHRDIKPANIFLAAREGGECIVKVLDFGIAKVKMDHANETENAGLTRTGSMLGSPLYMSPEQARGSRHIDHRADIWSLGVVLYQLLCGRTPYQHIDALGELIIAITHDPPPHVQDFAPWVPPEVAAIAHRAVRQIPSERFESAGAMLEAIKPLLPNGWALHQDMIVPLPDMARAQVAGRLTVTSPIESAATMAHAQSGDIRASSPGVMVRVSSPDIAVRLSASDHLGRISSLPEAGSTASEMVQSQSHAPRERPASKAPLAIGVLLTAALVGGGVYLVTKPPGRTQGADIQAQPAPAPTAAPAAPPSVTPASTNAEPAPVAAASRRVKLVIVPTDAIVDIEGVATKAVNGIVEIVGAPGSVHRVRLRKGKSETTTDVIITDAGPAPPKVELSPATKKSTKGAGPSHSGITDKFE